MAKKVINTVKLGAFVIAGLLFLIILLYMIGRNRNLFGPTFLLKAQFENVQGLVPGNNVRYSGIEVGTVKRITIISDTVLEVDMLINEKMKHIIRNNAIVSIGSDGLMGNKVVNIAPVRLPAPLVAAGAVLPVRTPISTDDILQTLSNTNQDVAVIAAQLKTTVQRINNSTAAWKLLNDDQLPLYINGAAADVQLAAARVANMAGDLQYIVSNVKNGKGPAGALLTDTAFARHLQEAVVNIETVGSKATELAGTFTALTQAVQQDIQTGKGPVNALLKDSVMVAKINNSLTNIETGTAAFSQNMEALKHNFLFRGYFRKLEKQKAKTARQHMAVNNE